MTYQVGQLLHLDYNATAYGWFVFFATMSSYNFHWLLTGESHDDSIRLQWTKEHKRLHWALFILCSTGAIIFLSMFTRYWWPWFVIAGLLTFLYSAPKIPSKIFRQLSEIAFAKTLFLASVWTYVTTILPMILSKTPPTVDYTWLAVGRFLFIYAICILFDLRDREQDAKEGIHSITTLMPVRGVKILFYICLMAYVFTVLQLQTDYFVKILLTIPATIAGLLYNASVKSNSDYLYYFVLDGLMMLSALFTLFFSI